MICKNCSQSFKGNFCNYCGQNPNVNRINFRYILHEISDSIFQINHGLLFTAKELFIRPGQSIRQFLDGRRKQHAKPLAFVLMTSTLYVLASYIAGNDTFLGDMLSGMIEGLADDGADAAFTTPILSWLANHYAYSNLLFLPFFSLASYLAFVKSKFNYFEHLVLNCYIVGQQMIIYLAFSFIINVDSVMQLIPVFLGYLYAVWVFIQVFKMRSIFVRILLTLLTYLIVIFQLFIFIFIMVMFEFKS